MSRFQGVYFNFKVWQMSELLLNDLVKKGLQGKTSSNKFMRP